MNNIKDKAYSNTGNEDLVDHINFKSKKILDVGIGNGSNASLIRNKLQNCEIHGITISGNEYELSESIYDKIWLADIQNTLPDELIMHKYDTIIFSHILEHIAYPDEIIRKFKSLLIPKGKIIIAVPNFVHYSIRIKMLFGNFNYTQSGILDYTHLRFFTYNIVEGILFNKISEFSTMKYPSGKVPLLFFRKLLPKRFINYMDSKFTGLFPNLFSWQIIVVAEYNGE